MATRRLRSNFKGKKGVPASPQPPSPAQKWGDGLSVAAWISLVLLGIIALVVFTAKAQWSKSIDDRLSAWRGAYHLPEATVARFREIELEFHGSGNPFTSPITHTSAEVNVHHEKMAALMEPDTGKQFLKDMHRGRWQH